MSGRLRRPQVCPQGVNSAPALWREPAGGAASQSPASVSAGQEAKRGRCECHHTAGREDLRVRAGNPCPRERNPLGRRWASRHPQADRAGARAVARGFDPVIRLRVPLVGHPVSTDAARPRSHTSVGGRCQPNGDARGASVPVRRGQARIHSTGVTRSAGPAMRLPRSVPSTKEVSREQAYVPAEQPSPSQGARFPPAHADPCGPLDPVGPSSQGPQGPGRLSLGSATGSFAD